jgi:NAD(P)-dependent dehydrogenase (short-subunit alcohol dehydrogenase family)
MQHLAFRPGDRQAIDRDNGSFTLISGVLTDEYTAGGVIGTVINHMVEGFAKAAAVELPRGVRINCISPTVLTESVAAAPPSI